MVLYASRFASSNGFGWALCQQLRGLDFLKQLLNASN